MIRKNWFLQRVLIDRIGTIVTFIAIIIFLLTIVKAIDLISGEIPRREILGLQNSMLIEEFPPDFEDLLAFLRKEGANSYGVLWYPLNWLNYIIIPDKNLSKGIFSGTSLVPDATRQRDFPGFIMFGLQQEIIKKSMINGNYQPLCRAIWENSINVVAVNKYLLNDQFRNRFESMFAFGPSINLYDAQRSKQFNDTFFGSRLASFGQGFDLYQIHPNLFSEQIEVYEGDVLSKKLSHGDWCSRGDVGRLASKYTFDLISQKYSVKVDIKNAKKISITLPEKFGYRYRLKIENPMADQVESVEYVQLGAKLVSRVTFKGPASGEFLGRFENRSLLERNFKAVFLLQGMLLLVIAVYIIYSRVRNKSAGNPTYP